MIAGLKPYPAMKDAGFPWLGEIPQHWEVRRNGRLFQQRNQTGFGHLPILEVSLKTGVRIRDFDNSKRKQVMSDREKYKRAAKSDIAYNMMRMWQGAVGVAPVDGLVSPAYVIARPNPGTNSDYYSHLFRTDAYKAEVDNYSRGIVKDRNRLYWDEFKQMPSVYPPPDEQTAIVRFISYVDRRIRQSIRAKQKLITLLEEYKQAIIHQAVTRGLDPDVRLKPSGVEWLGDVPEHWEVRRLKTICEMKSGEGITGVSIEDAGEYPVYGGNGIRGFSSQFTHDGEYVLVGRQGALCGNVHAVLGKFWASEHAVVVRLKHDFVLNWFAHLLRTMNLNQYSIAAAQPGLAVERVLNLYCPVPGHAEQLKISSRIMQVSERVDNIATSNRKEIEHLRELRSLLITEVVTGKLDVRGLAAAPPETDPLGDHPSNGDLDAEEETCLDELGTMPEEPEA